MNFEFYYIRVIHGVQDLTFEPGLILKCFVPFIQMLLGRRNTPLRRKSTFKNRNYMVYFCAEFLIVLDILENNFTITLSINLLRTCINQS